MGCGGTGSTSVAQHRKFDSLFKTQHPRFFPLSKLDRSSLTLNVVKAAIRKCFNSRSNRCIFRVLHYKFCALKIDAFM